jgi:uncharacterized HAD superfamily protein
MVYPSIGIDIDGCITDFPIFFQVLSSSWPGKVFIITMRFRKDDTELFLKNKNIRFDQIHMVNSFAEKGNIIRNYGISAFFDDQPEILKSITPNCACFLVRNEGNFDFERSKFTMSSNTADVI